MKICSAHSQKWRRNAVFAILLSIVCLPNGARGALIQARPGKLAAHPERLIQPSISGLERQEVTAALTRLDEIYHFSKKYTYRDFNYGLYDDARHAFFYNRNDLHGALDVFKPINRNGSLYKGRHGLPFPGPAPQPRPSHAMTWDHSLRMRPDYNVRYDTGSGPYRRIFSNPNTYFQVPPSVIGQFGEAAYILGPCNAQNHISNDEGYAYMGGWGLSGGAVDAGLKYNLNDPNSHADVYQMFMVVNGTFITTPSYSIGDPFFRWPCGQEVWTQFSTGASFLPSDSQMFLLYTSPQPSSPFNLLEWDGNPPGGWNGDSCIDCILKRMTSIAQSPENLTDGSTFGPIDWYNAQITCNNGAGGECDIAHGLVSEWDPPTIGGCMEWPLWSTYMTPPPYPTDCNSTPVLQNNPLAVQVSWSFNNAELDTINLANGAPPQTQGFAQQVNFTVVPGLTGKMISNGNGNGTFAVSTVKQGANYALYKWHGGSSWSEIDSPGATRVAVGSDGNPWIVQADGTVYRYDGSEWNLVSGSASDIYASSDGSVYILGTDSITGGHSLYKWNGGSGFTKKSAPGAVALAVDPSEGVWLLNSSHSISYGTPGNFQTMPGSATDVAVNAHSVVFVIGTDKSVYQWTGTGWAPAPGQTGKAISVGSRDKPWVVDSSGNIYQG